MINFNSPSQGFIHPSSDSPTPVTLNDITEQHQKLTEEIKTLAENKTPLMDNDEKFKEIKGKFNTLLENISHLNETEAGMATVKPEIDIRAERDLFCRFAGRTVCLAKEKEEGKVPYETFKNELQNLRGEISTRLKSNARIPVLKLVSMMEGLHDDFIKPNDFDKLKTCFKEIRQTLQEEFKPSLNPKNWTFGTPIGRIDQFLKENTPKK